MDHVTTLFQQVLGAQGVRTLSEIVNSPAENRRQQQSAEEFAARIAELRAKLERHEHLGGVKSI